MGPKSKDQILQKWDPVSKRLVNIYIHPPIPPPGTILTILGVSYARPAGVPTFSYSISSDTADSVNVKIYNNGFITQPVDGTQVATIDYDMVPGTNISASTTSLTWNDIYNRYLYIVATPSNGAPVYSELVRVPNPVQTTLAVVTAAHTFTSLQSLVTYQISSDIADYVNVEVYNNGLDISPLAGTPLGPTSAGSIFPASNLNGTIELPLDADILNQYLYIVATPSNGSPVFSSAIFVPNPDVTIITLDTVNAMYGNPDTTFSFTFTSSTKDDVNVVVYNNGLESIDYVGTEIAGTSTGYDAFPAVPISATITFDSTIFTADPVDTLAYYLYIIVTPRNGASVTSALKPIYVPPI